MKIRSMIIRAVSDSDSDGDDQLFGSGSADSGSVFGGPPHATFQSPGGATGAVAKRVWVSACVAIVVLLLADLAALVGAWASDSGGVASDNFALLPWLISGLSVAGGGFSMPSATTLNHWVGIALVSVWVYSRESASSGGRQQQRSGGAGWALVERRWVWIGAVVALGHLVTCLYVLSALLESNGDRAKFWLGSKKKPRRAYPDV